MNAAITSDARQFHEWWRQVTASLYVGTELKTKETEGFDPTYFRVGVSVHSDDRIVGCAAVFDNPYLICMNEAAASIGKCECVDDPAVAARLLQAAMQEARATGKPFLVAPLDGSTWDAYRYPTSFERPLIFTEGIYKPWYSQMFEAVGFATMERYTTRLDRSLVYDTEKAERVRSHLAQTSITFRPIALDRYEEELDAIWKFCIQSFRSNVLFTPITAEAFVEKYVKVKPIIDPNYVLLAEEEGRLVGIVFCLPNIFETTTRTLIIKTLARLPEKRYAGLGYELATRIYDKAREDGIAGIYHAFMHVNNASSVVSEEFSGEDYREYVLLGKRL